AERWPRRRSPASARSATASRAEATTARRSRTARSRRPTSPTCSGTGGRPTSATCPPSAATGRRPRSPASSTTCGRRRGERRVAVSVEAPPVTADWKRGRVTSWLTTTDHKRIGILYIATSLVFFGAGGILALLMRAQLATPNEHIVTQNSYDELFTIHGTTMIFLVVVPILAGFGNYLVPLMIGAKDMAFPRLNALSYWLFLFGGITLYMSFLAKGGPASASWTMYPPLSEKDFSPGHGVDLW